LSCLPFLSELDAATITTFEVYHSQKEEFNYLNVCQEYHKEKEQLLLIGPSPQNPLTQLDCMGLFVDVKEFCLKKIQHQNDFVRGYIDDKTKKVVCQRGNKIVLNLDCGIHNNSSYCQTSKE